jgi:Flp pilus assembly protein TadD
VLGLCGATIARPFINLSGQGGYEEGQWGYAALLANRNRDAVRWFRDAIRYQPRVASFWYDLGIAYQRLDNPQAASTAYQRAYELEPSDASYAEAAGKKPKPK